MFPGRWINESVCEKLEPGNVVQQKSGCVWFAVYPLDIVGSRDPERPEVALK